jgi:methylglutaconyl-CoA hydratase
MIRIDIDEAVAVVTLDRAEVRNALGAELIEAVAGALEALESNDEVRAVVLTGAGTVFCAGADLRSMKGAGGSGHDDNRADARRMGALFHRIADFPKPVVARVNGPAIGGGVGLMAACDIVVAEPRAHFQFSEVRLGLVPAVISPFCIARLGEVRARRLFLTGERIDAATAERWGLVDIVAGDGGLDEATDEVLAAMRMAGPRALVAAKELVSALGRLDGGQVLDYTSSMIARLRASDEAQEGMSAFLEKRPASWVRAAKRSSGS